MTSPQWHNTSQSQCMCLEVSYCYNPVEISSECQCNAWMTSKLSVVPSTAYRGNVEVMLSGIQLILILRIESLEAEVGSNDGEDLILQKDSLPYALRWTQSYHRNHEITQIIVSMIEITYQDMWSPWTCLIGSSKMTLCWWTNQIVANFTQTNFKIFLNEIPGEKMTEIFLLTEGSHSQI